MRNDVDLHRIEVAIIDFVKDREPSYDVEVRINSKLREFDGSFRKKFLIQNGDKDSALAQARETVKNVLTGIKSSSDTATKTAQIAQEIIRQLS